MRRLAKQPNLATLEAEGERCIQAGQRAVLEFAAIISAIHAGRLFSPTWTSFDTYCSERWGITGARGRQLVDAHATAKAIAGAMGTENEIELFLAAANEGQMRVLKNVPPEAAAATWKAANADGKVTAKKLAAVAPDVTAKLNEMTRDEQREAIAGIERQATEEFRKTADVEVARIGAKRARLLSVLLGDTVRCPAFRNGSFVVEGGVAGLAARLAAECSSLHGELVK